jgi:histidine kinase-like protein
MSDGTTNRRSTAQPAFPEERGARLLLEMKARIPGEFRFIAPEIDRIVRLVGESRCAVGNEDALELALQEALNNALVHGNGLDPGKQIRIVAGLMVTDQGQGFDPKTVPNPLMPERTCTWITAAAFISGRC